MTTNNNLTLPVPVFHAGSRKVHLVFRNTVQPLCGTPGPFLLFHDDPDTWEPSVWAVTVASGCARCRRKLTKLRHA